MGRYSKNILEISATFSLAYGSRRGTLLHRQDIWANCHELSAKAMLYTTYEKKLPLPSTVTLKSMIRLSSQCCPRIPRLNGSASETSTAARIGEVISMLFVSTGHWPAHMLSTMNSPCVWLTCSTCLRDERFVYRFDSICTFLLRTVPQLPLSPFPGKD